jgi:hypothetical protein
VIINIDNGFANKPLMNVTGAQVAQAACRSQSREPRRYAERRYCGHLTIPPTHPCDAGGTTLASRA